MAIKLVTPEQAKEPKPKYPYFGMYDDGGIVFFTALNTGVCVTDVASEESGVYSKIWVEANFTPIEGPITFENEF